MRSSDEAICMIMWDVLQEGQDTDGPVRQISHGCLRMAMKNKGREVSGCQSVRPKNRDR